jgi:uncharacterized coiled-coil protein SlyX
MDNDEHRRLESRLVALEERLAWYETEREALDDVVRDLYDRVAALTVRLESMAVERVETET